MTSTYAISLLNNKAAVYLVNQDIFNNSYESDVVFGSAHRHFKLNIFN